MADSPSGDYGVTTWPLGGHLSRPISATSKSPLLLHFDVNKTIIISDMIMNKSVEYSIREVIANMFWGRLDRADPEKLAWTWLGRGPSVDPPKLDNDSEDSQGAETISYLRFCRRKDVCQDPTLSKLATRSFDLVGDAVCKQQMVALSDQVVDMMTIPANARTDQLKQTCGLGGEWRLIFPSFFKLIGELQLSGQQFTVCFRSFGSDLPRIRVEWNAFCNMQHPLYNHYLEGIGPMNGTVKGVPDRRLGEQDINTMYRDDQGSILALQLMTNGQYEGEWDQWARSKQAEDTRQGRTFFQKSGIRTVSGYARIQAWFKKQLDAGRSQLVKDDFAWWHRCGEVTNAGKLLIGIDGVQQIFFDDNIDLDSLRIVDARSSQAFEPVPADKAVGKACLRVDPLRAMLEEDYFGTVFKEVSQTDDPYECCRVLCDSVPKAKLKAGDVVKIMKHTSNYGRLATIVDPCWHGLVKVEMFEKQAPKRRASVGSEGEVIPVKDDDDVARDWITSFQVDLKEEDTPKKAKGEFAKKGNGSREGGKIFAFSEAELALVQDADGPVSPQFQQAFRRTNSVLYKSHTIPLDEVGQAAEEPADFVLNESEERIQVEDMDNLLEILKEAKIEVGLFGATGTTYKSVQTLYQELVQGKCYLKRNSPPEDDMSDSDSSCTDKDEIADFRDNGDNYPLLRVMQVVRVKLMCKNLILCESHEQLPDGRLRSRNGFLPATKKRAGETLSEAIGRWGVEELQLKLTDEQKREAMISVEETHDVQPESMSYPLPVSTHMFEVTVYLKLDTLEPTLLARLGLPGGSMFTTKKAVKKETNRCAAAVEKAGSRSFWSWYSIEVWEAMQEIQEVELPDIHQGMALLFKGDPRQQGYQQLLMQMFDSFDASKLCGGMSGSLVLQVQPVDPIHGAKLEPCIVKLDKAQCISREIVYSKRVCNVLSDRAARILGDGCFVTDDAGDEYGAFKLELAGGCWQVPELSGGTHTKDLLSTFKDLLIVHSMRLLLNEELIHSHLLHVHGDVEAVLRELLGPGGMLRVLRREGLFRNPHNLFKSFFFQGKDTRWNPLFQEGHFHLEPMQRMWRRTFGKTGTPEMPNVRKQVEDLSAHFAELDEAQTPLSQYKPIVGLAHGDLNAMNVLIDVMDAVWLIDFAFSEEKPICWDLAKLEIAFMFEYAVLPVCWTTVLDFAGDTEEEWKARKVHAWLKVGEGTTFAILRELKAMRDTTNTVVGDKNYTTRVSAATSSSSSSKSIRLNCPLGMEDSYETLGNAIQTACESAWPEPLSKADQKKKDSEELRLHALLLASQEEEDGAMLCAKAVSDCMMAGHDLNSVLDPPPLPEEAKVPDGASVVWCWAKCQRLRMFLKEEWETLQVRLHRELGGEYVADESPLVFWLGLLQESHRLLGYFDVAPWVKVWAVSYLEKLVAQIRQFSNPPDAMDRVALVRTERGQTARQEIIEQSLRPYPELSQIKLHSSVLNGSTRDAAWGELRRRIRIAHAESSMDVKSCCSSQFVKVLGVQSVKRSDEHLQFRNADDLDIPSSIPFGLDGFSEAGFLQLCRDGALIKVNAVVPLPENHAFGSDDTYVDVVEVATDVTQAAEECSGDPFIIELQVAQEAVFCYPLGTRLRIADPMESSLLPVGPGCRLRHGTILELQESSGNYRIRWDGEEDVSLTEVNPIQGNHVLATNVLRNEGTQLIVYQEPDRFVEAVVVKRKESVAETSRHLLRASLQGKWDDTAEPKDWWVDLNDFNHCLVLGNFSAHEFEAELQRYRVSLKAKHSLIWTVTSERADCLEGPVPRVAARNGEPMNFWNQVQDLLSEDDERLASQTLLKGWLIVGQPGSGKSCVLCKIVMQCLGSSKFLIPLVIPVVDFVSRIEKAEVGQCARASITTTPVAGMALDDGESLIDWYIRSCYGDDSQRYFMLVQAFQCHRLLLLFDGLDEAGHHLQRMQRCLEALVAQDHRIVATARISQPLVAPTISPPRPSRSSRKSLTEPPVVSAKLAEPHMGSASGSLSSRPWRKSKDAMGELSLFNGPQRLLLKWLYSDTHLFKAVELLPFNKKDCCCMVDVLLSREAGITSEDKRKCERFFQDFMDTLDEQERRMWNTPLMVAMLVASWREKRRQEQEKNMERSSERSHTKTMKRRFTATLKPESLDALKKGSLAPEHKVDIQSIYTVALDLLLRRFQSRLQADRHKLKKSLADFKSLLEVIATHLSRKKIEAFTEEEDVLPLLKEHSIAEQVWHELAEAIKEGRVPLLVAETDEESNGMTRFLFAYRSFQSFLTRSPENFGSRRNSLMPDGSQSARTERDSGKVPLSRTKSIDSGCSELMRQVSEPSPEMKIGSFDSLGLPPRAVRYASADSIGTMESNLGRTVSSGSRAASKQRKAARKAARCQTAPGFTPDLAAKNAELPEDQELPEAASQESKESSKSTSSKPILMTAMEKGEVSNPLIALEPVLLKEEKGEAEQLACSSSRASSSTEMVLPRVSDASPVDRIKPTLSKEKPPTLPAVLPPNLPTLSKASRPARRRRSEPLLKGPEEDPCSSCRSRSTARHKTISGVDMTPHPPLETRTGSEAPRRPFIRKAEAVADVPEPPRRPDVSGMPHLPVARSPEPPSASSAALSGLRETAEGNHRPMGVL